MLIDFKDVKKALKETLERFDHRFLNELEPFKHGVNPTAENLARIIYGEFAAHDIFKKNASLYSVTVYETPGSCVTYTED